MRTIIAMSLFVVSVAQAEIYKAYDENGNVIFSDVPSQSAEKLEAKPIATVPALPRHIINEKIKPLAKDKDNIPTSYKISFSGLESQSTIQKEQEPFQVSFQFEPPLHKNHIFMISLDGQDLGKNNFAPKIDPKQFNRGQHRFDFKVIDKNQKVIQSESIDFFIQQPSVNMPKK